jgi:hypothetical protein
MIGWSLLAAMAAVLCEYLYRVLPGSWWHWVWLWIPLSLTISFSINKLITAPGVPLVGALIIWSLCIMGTRICVSVFVLKDYVSMGTWIALGLMLLARVAQQVWK